MIIREFDFARDDPERLWAMYEAVYPGSRAFRDRWPWEVRRYPRGGVCIFVADSGGEYAGMTMRTAVQLYVQGEKLQAWFATNSLVLPRYRGQGVIGKLYDRAAENGDLQLSKGTAPAMYRLLLKMGYHEIVPNTYLTCVVAPLAWALWRLTGRAPRWGRAPWTDGKYKDFTELTQIGKEGFDAFNGSYYATLSQDADYFTWRYFEAPGRTYRVYARNLQEQTVSRCVLRMEGRTAMVVDLRWDTAVDDEPGQTIRFIKYVARSQGAVKVVAWGTLASLRQDLRREGFRERSDSPRFSYFNRDPRWASFPWERAHFVHGDGDAEYL
jgi:GNAT superfamily N-acetyltransferase